MKALRARGTHVYCELNPYDVDVNFIRDFKPARIILSGGPNSVTEGDTPRAPQIVFELGVPVLGICYTACRPWLRNWVARLKTVWCVNSVMPNALLGKISNRIINEVRSINRVVYDISGKPPATYRVRHIE